MARAQFYMHDWYGLSISRQQPQIFSAWDRMYSVTDWERERERDQRIARVMGHSNPYVTGERAWTVGQRPSGDDLKAFAPAQKTSPQIQARQVAGKTQDIGQGPVIGNRNKRVYHLPQGCPSYNQVANSNHVPFGSAQAAEAAGYRLAGNFR